MSRPSPHPPSRRAGGRPERPWYLMVAMGLMWIIGLLNTSAGCRQLSYLRGDDQLVGELESELDGADHPMMRQELLRQKAHIEAMGQHHRRAFPLVAAHMVLSGLMVLGAGGVIIGRRKAKGLAVQAIAANALLVVVTFALSGPMRAASIQAVTADAMVHEPEIAGESEEQRSSRILRTAKEGEIMRGVAELIPYGLALLALTRRGSRDYFAALDAAVPDAEHG